MKGYRHLTQRQRFIIQDLRDLGKTLTEIARETKVHRTTIGRELRRHSTRKAGYRALGAQRKALDKRRFSYEPRRKISGALEELIQESLELRWSPEQISGRLKVEGEFSISHEAIYRWIYKFAPGYKVCLRLRGKYRRRGQKKRRRSLGPFPRKQISERPAEANERLQTGHWERDLVEGRRSGPSLLVMVDRYSRYTKIERVFSHSSQEVNLATVGLLKGERAKRTITNDNGVEFGGYQQLEGALNIPVFYTTPYASWQRGSVENTNGLIRQFYPKKTDFLQVPHTEMKAIESALNHRPKKILGYKTPYEVHFSVQKTLIKKASTYKRYRSQRLRYTEENFWREYWQNYFREESLYREKRALGR